MPMGPAFSGLVVVVVGAVAMAMAMAMYELFLKASRSRMFSTTLSQPIVTALAG